MNFLREYDINDEVIETKIRAKEAKTTRETKRIRRLEDNSQI